MYTHGFLIILVITILFPAITLAIPNQVVGVVEGFYWEESDAVNGQWGQYSLNQRLQLISLLAQNGLGIYWSVPQSVDTIAPWTTAEANGWAQTAILGNAVGVKIIYGLRPGWLSSDANFSAQLAKIAEIHNAGIRSYSLNFDDAEGVASPEQQQREVNLAAAIKSEFPDMELAAIVPYCYYQSCAGAGATIAKWSATMKIIDTIPQRNAPMVTTGSSITPDSMTPRNFPTLASGRPNWFWDNWIAVDSNDRIPWGLGIADKNIRDRALFANPYGYVLNLAFPLERTIHQIHCVGKLASGSGSTCTSESAATAWAQWLAENGFLHGKNISSVKNALKLAIEEDIFYNNIAQMELERPDLAGIFSVPPDNLKLKLKNH